MWTTLVCTKFYPGTIARSFTVTILANPVLREICTISYNSHCFPTQKHPRRQFITTIITAASSSAKIYAQQNFITLGCVAKRHRALVTDEMEHFASHHPAMQTMMATTRRVRHTICDRGTILLLS